MYSEEEQKIAQVLIYAQKHRGDCTTLVTFIVLKATGMLDLWYREQARKQFENEISKKLSPPKRQAHE